MTDKEKQKSAEEEILKGAEEAAGDPAEESEGQRVEETGAAQEDGRTPGDEGMTETDRPVPEESPDLRYTRLYAEFQNYRKRTRAEGYEKYIEGKKDLAAGLLDVLDNFERAILSDASAGVDPGFVEGMDMIRKQMIDVLAKNDIEEIEALGADFDPKLHQGVGTEKTDEYESGKVSLVLQKGYAIRDKVIRPSMVKVAE
ncbi:MAG: nucleotide exchange factor GrpE [Clostridiales Family XIII bacterium]|jgi:molecular chaperone GrpE|nr:nucleotide exchange factor GrpE [Clostridiales Family XIII bacterium]